MSSHPRSDVAVVVVERRSRGIRLRRANRRPARLRLRLRPRPSIRASRRWLAACSVTSTSGRSRARTMDARTPGRGRPPSRSPRTVSLRLEENARSVPRRQRARSGAASRAAGGRGRGLARHRSSTARGPSGAGTSGPGGGSDVVAGMVLPVASASCARQSSQSSASDRRCVRSTAARDR